MGEIGVPTLGVFGANDNVVRPDQAAILSKGVPHAHVRMMSHSRHFPMVDEPGLFRQTLLSFLLTDRVNGPYS
jgi:pimeloyl-ACP methyl ester carboxylesterase